MDSEEGFTGPVNVGNPREFTIRELAEKVIELTGSKSKLNFQLLPDDDAYSTENRQPVHVMLDSHSMACWLSLIKERPAILILIDNLFEIPLKCYRNFEKPLQITILEEMLVGKDVKLFCEKMIRKQTFGEQRVYFANLK